MPWEILRFWQSMNQTITLPNGTSLWIIMMLLRLTYVIKINVFTKWKSFTTCLHFKWNLWFTINVVIEEHIHCAGRTGLSVQVRSFSIVNLQWMLVLMSTHQPVNYLGIGLATLGSVTGNSRKKSTINDAMHKLHMAIYANRKWKFWMHCTTSMWW